MKKGEHVTSGYSVRFLVSVLETSINVLSKSKSRNYVTWTKLFLSVSEGRFVNLFGDFSLLCATPPKNQLSLGKKGLIIITGIS